ncbi:leucine-rich repeat and IQ domain-containing protein 3 [Microcaecilia unicolor]|uniref:Leucine-rich repeat and IQ domain-containing protein 3 n=1 Tax=Microcaecilia unicolor TaxID=1415580 RepID=A0A6P7Y247_9AMPH|nr:leucine-rich repeat and IQ domain-containing protein 3 [Microcaecilia unicolor]
MKEFIESIYFVSSSEKLLLEHGQNANQRVANELKDLVLVRLNKLLLQDMIYLQHCISLKICILSNNCISNISPLKSCSRLVKLDLHGNQIQLLPEREFWSKMGDLKLLYLHNNGIGKLTNVESLSGCPSLTGLTLFDTPLSLNKNYRHIIVNSIWPLKALDNYVISDEEIIEDLSLNEKFKALNPHLFLHFLPVLRKEASFQDEINVVRDIISKINQILAHNSPVLIIQRRIRGYLTRKRLGISPLDEIAKRMLSINDERQQICSQNMTFLDKMFMNNIVKTEPDEEDLRSSFMKKIEDDENCMKDIPSFSFLDQVHACCIILKPKEEKKKKQPKKYSHLISKGLTHFKEAVFKEEKLEFRLPVFRAPVLEGDPVRNMLLLNQDIGNDIRFAVRQCHSIIQNTPKPKVIYQAPVSLEKKTCAKMHDSARLLPFYAIEKAYKERERYQIKAEKVRRVKEIYSEKINAKQNIETFTKNKSKEILTKHENDSMKLHQALYQRKVNKSQEIEKVKQKYTSFINDKKERTAENLLVQKFNSQRVSLTNAVLKHDRLMKHLYDIETKHRTTPVAEEEKTYCVVPRQLELQPENAAGKVTVASIVLQKAHDKLLQARAEVAAVKLRKTSVEPQ